MEELITGRSCHPRREEEGWRCDRWRTAEGEWFCGLCAKPLPPVAFALEPAVGRSALVDNAVRRIAIVCERTPQLTDEDLDDFVLPISITDPEEVQDDELAIPLDPGEEKEAAELDLQRRAGLEPFEVFVGLRHVLRDGVSEPVAVGAYDYPTPTVSIGGPIALPREHGAFSVDIRISTPSSTLLAVAIEGVAAPLWAVVTAGSRDGDIRATFYPDEAAWRAIQNVEGRRNAILTMRFKGLAAPIEVKVVLERKTPPRLEFLLPQKTAGLTGRRARIPARVTNRGGAAAVIEALAWRMADRQGVMRATGALTDMTGRVIGGQEPLDAELRPLLCAEDGEPLAPGLYQLTFDIRHRERDGADAEVQTDVHKIEISINAETVYGGMVCIDFGTTDTAASLIPPGETYFDNYRSGRTPRPIELGRLAMPSADVETAFFLPTRAAVGLDPQGGLVTLYAHDAINEVENLAHGRLIDRLKWRLNQNESIEGFAGTISVTDLAAGYLDHVRRLIEEHPDVAARIETVIATRPARFGAEKEKVLIDCFSRAEMIVDQERFGEQAPPMVSESWPPLLFMLPMAEDPGRPPSKRLLDSLFGLFPTESPPALIDLADLKAEPYYLCTFDIGGGSTDVSLLEMLYDEGRIRVTDKATFTDENFAGEGFRDLIVEELARLQPGAPRTDGDSQGRANLAALRAAAWRIQHFPRGPFARSRGAVQTSFDALVDMDETERRHILASLAEPSLALHSRHEAADKFVRAFHDSFVDPLVAGFEQTIPLRLQDGADGTLTLDIDSLLWVLVRIALKFFETYSTAIGSIVSRIQDKLENGATGGKMVLLLTGRGSLFPLARLLIQPIAEAGFDATTYDATLAYQVAGEPAKAVTSWGGVALRAAREADGTLEFAGLGGTGYAVYARNTVSGGMAYAQLSGVTVDGVAVFGVPLADLDKAFILPRRLKACADQGPDVDPEADGQLSKFNLATELRDRPQGWLLFEPKAQRLFVDDGPVAADGESEGEGSQ